MTFLKFVLSTLADTVVATAVLGGAIKALMMLQGKDALPDTKVK